MISKNFDSFNFHDHKIYAIGFDEDKYEFLVDMDIIEEWIELDGKYMFKIFPATVVFHNVWNIEIDISMNSGLTINNILRYNPCIPKNIKYLSSSSIEYDWTIELMQGKIEFKSIGFKLYQRKEAKISDQQNFDFDEREGMSLKKNGIKSFGII